MAVQELSSHELKTISDFQQLIDDIESLLASVAGISAEAVHRLHESDEQAIKIVNLRLRACDELLKKGLRNEALGMCDAEPKLLDLYLIVDFPERDSWLETIKQCGLTSTELLGSIATELNDAYSSEKPLAELKYQVRLHALARSPLPIRISLMRRLSKLDQTTTLWEDDLKVFEKARHNQLASEIQAAIKSNSFETLSNLDAELRSSEWLVAPAKSLIKQVSDTLASASRLQARLELQRLEPELTGAFAAFDVVRGKQARDAWRKWAAAAALSEADPLATAVAPALNWLQEQDQAEQEQADYDGAVTALTRALDKGAGQLVLEEKYHALMSFGRGIPEDLQQRLEERLARIQEAIRWKWRVKIAAVAAAVLVATGITVFSIQTANYRALVTGQVAVLRQMLNENQLTEAKTHLSGLEASSPKVAAEPEIQKLKSELQLTLETDAVRQADFQRLMLSARNNGVDQASLATIPAAKEALGKAWDIARQPSEKTEVKDLAKSVEDTQKNLQLELDGQFQAELKKKDEEYARLRTNPLDNLLELQRLKTEIRDLYLRPGVSDTVREKRTQNLIAELDESVRLGVRLKAEARILQEINANIGDRVKFLAELKRFADTSEFAGTSRQKDFQRVLQEDAALLTGFQSWSELLESLMQQDLTKIDATRSTKLRSEAERLLREHPGFPFVSQVQEAISFLGKGELRGRGSSVMEQLLALKLFKLLSVRTENKLNYYFLGEPPKEDPTKNISIKYFSDTEFRETKTLRIEKLKIQSDSKWRSPQMIFEGEVTDLLNKLRDDKGANWDHTFVEILGKLFNSPLIDPILKVQLFPHILKAAGEGSDFLPKRLEPLKAEIERENLNSTVNWVSPDDPDAVPIRERAKKMFERQAFRKELLDVKPLLKEVDQALQTMKAPRFNSRYAWIGWLHKEGDRWTATLRGGATVEASGVDLFALTKSDESGIQFVRAARIQQGKVTVEAGSTALIEGRPLFEKKADPSSSVK